MQNPKSSSFQMHYLPQNCEERTVPKVVRFEERLSEGIRATNAQGYLRSTHNFVVIQADHNQGAHGEKLVFQNLFYNKLANEDDKLGILE